MPGFQCWAAYLPRSSSPCLSKSSRTKCVWSSKMNWPLSPWRGRRPRPCRGLGLGDEPHRPEHVVHGEKRGRHARRRLEEASAADVEPPCVVVGELADTPFDLSLLLALRRRVVLAVRDDLGWNRRGIANVELIRVGDILTFLVGQPHKVLLMKVAARSAPGLAARWCRATA